MVSELKELLFERLYMTLKPVACGNHFDHLPLLSLATHVLLPLLYYAV